jgi:hypothetical protein
MRTLASTGNASARTGTCGKLQAVLTSQTERVGIGPLAIIASGVRHASSSDSATCSVAMVPSLTLTVGKGFGVGAVSGGDKLSNRCRISYRSRGGSLRNCSNNAPANALIASTLVPNPGLEGDFVAARPTACLIPAQGIRPGFMARFSQCRPTACFIASRRLLLLWGKDESRLQLGIVLGAMDPGRMPWAGMNDAFGVSEAYPERQRAFLEEIGPSPLCVGGVRTKSGRHSGERRRPSPFKAGSKSGRGLCGARLPGPTLLRQGDGEFGALGDLAGDGDFAAVGFDHGFDQA